MVTIIYYNGNGNGIVIPLYLIWLVVWNMFIFSYIGNFIIPTDFHIFQRGRSTKCKWLILGYLASLEGTNIEIQAGNGIEIPLYGYGSIPINTIFRGMNIHLPAILMFTRGTRF